MSIVPIASPATKSLPASPDSFGKNVLSVKAAGKLRVTVAPVTVSCLVFGSIERAPVEKSMLPRGARRLAPVGRAAVELKLLWAKSTPMPVLTSLVPTAGAAESQALGLSGLMLLFFVMVWPPPVSSSPALKSGAAAPPATGNV
jgi:hypothetical protein